MKALSIILIALALGLTVMPGTQPVQIAAQAAPALVSATPFPKSDYPPLMDYMTFVWSANEGEGAKALLDCTIVSMGPGPSEADAKIIYDTDMKSTMRIRFQTSYQDIGLRPGDHILVYGQALAPLVKSQNGGLLVEAYIVEAQHFEKIK